MAKRYPHAFSPRGRAVRTVGLWSGAHGRRVLGALVTAGAIFILGAPMVSCGYRAGLAPQIAPVLGPEALLGEGIGPQVDTEGESARSIGIEIFGNESLLPNLERELHASLTSAARRHAAMNLVSPRRADLVIKGRIAGFRREGGARTVNNRTVETINTITVEAELVDASTGRILGRTTVRPRMGTAIDVPGREPQVRNRALSNASDRLLLLLLAGLEYGVTRPEDLPGRPARAPKPASPPGTPDATNK